LVAMSVGGFRLVGFASAAIAGVCAGAMGIGFEAGVDEVCVAHELHGVGEVHEGAEGEAEDAIGGRQIALLERANGHVHGSNRSRRISE